MKDWVFKGIVPLLAVLIGIAFQAQRQTPWGPWVKAATITASAVIVGYALVSMLRAAWPAVLRWQRDRFIESDVAHDVFAVASRLAETMSTNFTLSAGNVLNPLCDAKVCDAVLVNAYGAHFGTLQLAMRDLAVDLKGGRLPVINAMPRLCELHRNYVRVCSSLAPAVLRSDRQDLRRSWDAIAGHANSLSTQLIAITHRIQVRRNENPSCYFESVPTS